MSGGKVSGPQASRAIFLAGFMAAGKTTVGRMLAARLQAGFVDLDERITERERRSILEIFQNSGEDAFRDLETEALRDVLGSAPPGGLLVIALGGGTLEREENRNIIRSGDHALIFLDAPVAELFRRCSPATGNEARPLATNEENFRKLYAQRQPQYLSAGLRVNTQDKPPQHATAEIERWLKQRWPQPISGRAREKT
jgi:shikimate kinase